MSQGITYDISLNASKASAALSGLRSSLSGLGGIASKVLAPLGVGLSFAGLAAGVKGALDLGGRLSDLSARTGESAANLAVLQQAFANAGMSAERIGPVLNIMQRAIAGVNEEGKSTTAALARLGVTSQQLKGTSALEQLRLLSQGMAAVTDPAERSAIAMQLFGRSGGEMLALLSDPAAMSDAANTVGSQAELLGRNAALFDRVSDLLASTGTKVQGFFVGVADQVAPILLPLLEKFQQLDLAKLGQQLGNIVAFLLAAFSSGQIGDILGSSILLAFQHTVNFLWAAIQGIGAGMLQYFTEVGRTFATVLSIVTKPDFWAGVGKILQSAALAFTAKLLDALNAIQGGFIALLRKFGADTLADSLQRGLEAREATADSLRRRSDDLKTEGGDLVVPYIEQYITQVKDSLGQITAAARNAATLTPDLIDTSAQQAVLDNALSAVFAALDSARASAQIIAKPTPSAAETLTTNLATPAPPTENNLLSTPTTTDRLAQIGGFVGAGRAVVERHLADTARATAATAKHTAALVQRTTHAGPAGVFVD